MRVLFVVGAKGGDFGCNGSVLMCRSESKDDCERKDAAFF